MLCSYEGSHPKYWQGASTGLAVWLGCVDTWTSCLLGSVLAEDAFGANQRLVSVPLSTVVNAGYEEQFSEMTSPAGARDMIFWRQVVPCCSSVAKTILLTPKCPPLSNGPGFSTEPARGRTSIHGLLLFFTSFGLSVEAV